MPARAGSGRDGDAHRFGFPCRRSERDGFEEAPFGRVVGFAVGEEPRSRG